MLRKAYFFNTMMKMALGASEYLAAESLMIYITHNSAIEDKGLDNAVVDDILSTLVTLDDEALAED